MRSTGICNALSMLSVALDTVCGRLNLEWVTSQIGIPRLFTLGGEIQTAPTPAVGASAY